MKIKLGMWPSFLLLILFVITAVFADFIAPHSPRQIDLERIFLPPFFQEGGTVEHLLGTDQQGRDILSRIIYGARISLVVALIGVFFAGSIGGMVGVIAGYFGGIVDSVISRAADAMLGFPTILLALILAVLLGASMFNVALVVIFVYWARYARLARSETLKIREMDYVTLSRIAGCSHFTVMLRHIVPNIMNSMVVLATFNVGTVITLESSLSFLGAGVPPPTPSWGGMCSDGKGVLVMAWWVSFMPGIAITLVVLSANLLGDWLRDRLDPKLRDL